MTTPIDADTYPRADQCAQIAVLTLEILADLRAWTDKHPGWPHEAVALGLLESMAMAAAVISPWLSAEKLRLTARMYVWAFAFDYQVDRKITIREELDDLLGRCEAVVRTGRRDDSNVVVSALSDCQDELINQPLYPSLTQLWIEKFDRTLEGVRYDWIAAHHRGKNHSPGDVQAYLDHSESVMMAICYLPRWAGYESDDLLAELDVLTAALEDLAPAVRLGNDLATFYRERDFLGENNILMYGVTEAWVRTKISEYAASVRNRLASLVRAGFPPAVELLRQLEWAVSFYGRADFRCGAPGISGAGTRAEVTA